MATWLLHVARLLCTLLVSLLNLLCLNDNVVRGNFELLAGELTYSVNINTRNVAFETGDDV